jgi:subtilisin-like proprotein convertase family protein
MTLSRRHASLGFLLLVALTSIVTTAHAAGSGVKRAEVPVRVEILPGVQDKWIDPSLTEPVPVIIFGAGSLNVRDINAATLVLGGAAVMKLDDGSLAAYRDEDGDGITDLVVSFASSGIRLGETATRATLTGRMRDGRSILGTGAIGTLEHARAEWRLRARPLRSEEKQPAIKVAIDVMPGDAENRIELGNRGTVPVAVLSGPGFDATALDPLALHLAGAPVTRRTGGGLASVQDVNADGLADLVVEVPKRFLRLDRSSKVAVLTGLAPDGRLVVGSDAIDVAETATLVFDSGSGRAVPEPPSVTFANTGSITINDNAAATPYPSTISVAGLPGVISKLRITLKNLSHTYPDDIDILLVGPTGQSLILMSDVGGQAPGVSNVTLTFDDDSAFALDPSSNPPTGTYRPINFGAGDTFPPPAPTPSAATTLQAFVGTNPNGNWSLFVVDDLGGDSGVIAGGWAVDFELASEFCNAGPLTINDVAPATPYPSSVPVAGLTGVVSKVTAVFRGLSHTYPNDIDALLVAPNGQPSMVMSDTGGINPGVSSVTLVLDDNAALTLDPGTNPASGTYRPSDVAPGDPMPGPAPPGPYPSNLGVFQGSDPNGVWNLFVVDDAPGDVGNLTRFCIDITTMTPIDDSNLAAITIPAGAPGVTSGPASPYPSSVAVSGVIGTLAKATVTITGLTHTFPQDLDILLTAPNGGNVLLMSDVDGQSPGVSGVTYTFDDAGPPMPVGLNVGSGTYKPTNDDSGGADALPGPAPACPYGSTLAGLAGGSPNGTWNLFVYDDAGGDVGSISSGWTLTLRTWLPPYGGCNVTPLTIPAGAPGVTQGPASAYPVGSIVLGVPVDLDQYKPRIDLIGLTHSYPRDLDILLVGPQGQNVLLMSDAGGNGPGVNNVNLTFDDDAPAGVAQLVNPTSGAYKPTDFEPGDIFPGPAPAGPYGTSLSVFKGTNPLGGWSLFVYDDAVGDYGSMSQWCLSFIPSIGAGDVPNLRFTDKVTAAWDAGPNATSYNLYRGSLADLPKLANPSVDSCLRGSSLTQQITGLAETPAPGDMYWYLVRGDNAQGEGPSGFERFGTLLLARSEDSSGSCP